MSLSIRLLSLSAAVLATTPAALANHAGINGVSCGYSTVQAAINAAPANSTVWIADGVHVDPGFVVNKRLTLERGTATCQPGGTGNAVLSFGGAGRAEIAGGLSSVVLERLTLFGGAGVDGGNLAIGANTHAYLDDVVVWLGTATNDGGGIFVDTGATLEADGLRMWSNSANDDGGGIFGAPGSTLDLEDSLYTPLELADNDAGDLGGGVACSGCTLTVRGADVTFDGNTADHGGGLAVITSGAATATAVVENGVFSDNVASFGGGAHVLTLGAVSFDSVDFEGNSAGTGGAMVVEDSTDVTVSEATFTANTATDFGGAIHVFTSNLDVLHSRFETNQAAEGGALFVTTEAGSDRFVTIDRSTLAENTATSASTGSGIDMRGSRSNVTLSNSQIVAGNSPASPGGAVVAQSGAFLRLLDSTVAYNDRFGVVTTGGATGDLQGVIVWANGNGVSGAGTAFCTNVQGGALPGGAASRNISANPLFTDPANEDLTLQAGSPSKDACPSHAGISLDGHDRNSGPPTDMGAYDQP